MTPPNVDNLQTWLVSRLAEMRGIDPRSIDVRERFHRYGLDSMGATRLLGELSALVGRSLPPTLVWEYPTIESLARFLTSPRLTNLPPADNQPITKHEREPIAIVGMACRFPKAPDLEAFWRLLAGGVDAITEVPKDRWDASALYDPNNAAVGKLNTRWGGFLDHVDKFDPQFFGISPREAIQMDPQQRLMMELSWEALEDAGIPAPRMRDGRAGVFFGALFTDHALLQDRAGREAITAHTSTGGAACIIANRVSYALGLQGPSMTVDTACSSSLVAIHLACQSLRSGESEMALAGGVNLMLVPETTMGFTKLGAMSPDGRCRAFDARGNGYVRSEGAGVVVLKRLTDALRDGDPIYAVVCGSAVNNDGASNGLTAPNPAAQQALLRDACRDAGISPRDVHYVEAHGTGTPLGDPIEASALGAAYGVEHDPGQPLLIGSVKTNIGHLEAAAGIAGLIKVALAMRHDKIPASLHFEKPNPHIDFDGNRIEVVSRPRPWPGPEGAPRCAGVSSFGYGGTNGHVILESLPRSAARLALVEAASPEALATEIEAVHAAAERGALPRDGVLRRRSPGMGLRLAVVASTTERLRDRLMDALAGGEGRGIFRGQTPAEPRRVVWVFSGQGSQWPGMGRSLVFAEPAFRAALERCDRALRPHLGWSVFEELLAGAPGAVPERVDVMWPVLFAIQIGLASLLRSFGVRPDVLIGHSIGEVAAAHVAGVLSLEDAARVISCQAKLVQRTVGKGIMLLASIGWDEAQAIAASSNGRISCAIAASPTATVFSGDGGALAGLGASLASRGIFARSVNASAAVHGPQMAFLRDELPYLLGELRPTRANIPLVSTLTGDRVQGEELGPAYWARQLREPVLLAQGAARLLNEGPTLFLEISPHPIVQQSIDESIQYHHMEKRAAAVATLFRREDEGRALREALGLLFSLGAPFPAGSTGAADTERIHLLPVSGQIDPAMRESARRLADLVDRAADLSLHDLCYTASVRRAHHRVRAVVTARGRIELLDALRAIAERREHPSVRTGMTPLGNTPGLVFVFPGQGSQWVGMGRQFLEEEPVFRDALEACDAAIRAEAGFSVLDELAADEDCSQLKRVDVVQPVLFAMEVALAAMWRAWGVEPDLVVGHSMGEIAAAHVAGALSLEDAVRVICRRSRLLRRVAGLGAMTLVELTLKEAELALVGYEDRLSVAVSNGPRSTVISGEPAALAEVIAKLEKRGVFCRSVKVDVASHSPQMDVLRDDLAAALAELRPRPLSLRMRSTVSGELVRGDELNADYWVRNLRAPVLFSAAVARAIEAGQTIFLEISPHPILTHSIEENLREQARDGVAIPSLRRHEDERHCVVDALGALHVHGRDLDWMHLYPEGGQCIRLPTYAWQRERYWLGDEARPRYSARPSRLLPRVESGTHPLLGTALLLSVQPSLHFWEQSLSTTSVPYLSDHRVQNEAVFPGAGYVEMVLAAAAEVHGKAPVALEEVVFERMMAVPEQGERRVQVVLVDEEPGRSSFQVSSREPGGKTWVSHATGRLRTGVGAPGARVSKERPRVIQARCQKMLDAGALYATMEEGGLSYGKSFQGIEQLWLGSSEGLGRVLLPADVAAHADAYQVHPALLDACFQVLLGIHLATKLAAAGTWVLAGVDRLRIHRALGQEVWVHARLHPGDGGGAAAGDLWVIDAEGRVQAEIEGLRMKRIDSGKAAATNALDDWVYAVEWRKKELAPESTRHRALPGPSAWLLLMDEGGTGAALAFLLLARGEACVRVRRGDRYTRLESGLFEIDPTKPEHYQRLLREAFGKEVMCRGVVFLFGLDAAPWQETTSESLDRDVGRGCIGAMYLIQALARQGWRDLPRLWLLTRGAEALLAVDTPINVGQAPLWGLGRTIALEHPELECTRVDLDPARNADEASVLLRELAARDREDQVAYRMEGRYVARLVKSSFDAGDEAGTNQLLEPANGRPFRLEIGEPGVLDRLALREVQRRRPGPGEVEIEVEAAGLNFLDVMKAMGIYPGLPPGPVLLGSECAGRIAAIGEGVKSFVVGQEVMAFGAGCFGSHVTTHTRFVVPKPSTLTFAEAAAIPVVFMTVYYAMHRLARVREGERILIHTATGGTGLAAIQLARSLGATIFATAGSEEKRAYLRSLGIEHVMDSRSLAFAEEILEKTDGEGVDIVLNTLIGEARTKSLEILAPYGRFLELSKREIYDDGKLALSPFRKSISYSAVDLAGMAVERPELLGTLLQETLSLFEAGVFQPLPTQVFPASAIQDAFRLMAQAKHIGKIAVVMNHPETRILPAQVSRFDIRADASYLITGGLGGLGLSLAHWLVERGARHLALVSRNAPSDVARKAIQTMERSGARIIPVVVDVSNWADLEAAVSGIEGRMPPLRGVVHAAGILDDRTLLEMSEEQFRRVLAPKMHGAWNLHRLTKSKPLDFFVLYSSSASLLGAPGQGNYSAANAFMDALAHGRWREGSAGMSIHWGPFAEVGLAAAHDNRGRRLSNRGIESLSPAQGLVALGRLLKRPRPEVGVLRLSVHQWLEFYPQIAGIPFWSELPREQPADNPPSSRGVSLRVLLERRPPAERLLLLERHILEQVGLVLRLDISRIDRLASFTSLGMDSLLSLELRNRLESTLGVRLSATLLFTYPNPASLADHLLDRMNLLPGRRGGLAISTKPGLVERAPGGSSKPHVEGERSQSVPSKQGEVQVKTLRQMTPQEAEALLEEEIARSEDYLS